MWSNSHTRMYRVRRTRGRQRRTRREGSPRPPPHAQLQSEKRVGEAAHALFDFLPEPQQLVKLCMNAFGYIRWCGKRPEYKTRGRT